MLTPHKPKSKPTPTSTPNRRHTTNINDLSYLNDDDEQQPPSSPRTIVPLNGLFLDAIWRCNCLHRPPAIKLQTKNGGVNHGRWFWTCQALANKKCGFFLWASDAEVREKIVVLGNSRWESFGNTVSVSGNGFDRNMMTPSKRMSSGLLTPKTERKIRDYYRPLGTPASNAETGIPRVRNAGALARSARARMMEEDDNVDRVGNDESDYGDGSIDNGQSFFDRLRDATGSGSDRELGREEEKEREERVESFFSTSPSDDEDGKRLQDSPRKTPRTTSLFSPGKRKRSAPPAIVGAHYEAMQPQQCLSPTQPQSQSNLPSSSWIPPSSAEPCLTPTPQKYPPQCILTTTSPTKSSSANNPHSLARETISLLEKAGVVIPRTAQEELVSLLNRHEITARSVERGRDVTREALKRREEQIRGLEERVRRAEREEGRLKGEVERLEREVRELM